MRLEHLPKAKKLAIALRTPYQFINKLRTIQPWIFEKIKNSQLELKFAGSYKKKRVYLLLNENGPASVLDPFSTSVTNTLLSNRRVILICLVFSGIVTTS